MELPGCYDRAPRIGFTKYVQPTQPVWFDQSLQLQARIGKFRGFESELGLPVCKLHKRDTGLRAYSFEYSVNENVY